MKIKFDISRHNIAGFLLAMTPFLRNYRIPYINVNLDTLTLLIILAVNLFDRAGMKREGFSALSRSVAFPVIASMTVYMLIEYYLIDVMRISSGTVEGNLGELFIYLFELWGLLFVVSDKRIRGAFKVHLVRITLFMSLVVCIQNVLYYTIGITLDKKFFIPFPNLYKPSVAQQVNQALVSNGLFRPSAFFLEPSHFAAYSVLALSILLFERERLLNKKSIFVSLAIVLSTSGLGIAASLLLWGAKIFTSFSTLKRKRIYNAFIFALVMLVAVIALYFSADSFRKSVNRVFFTNSNSSHTAIEGRLWSAEFLERLTGSNRYLGMGYRNKPFSTYRNSIIYVTGIVEILYCQGLLGAFVFGVSMAHSLYRMWRYRNIQNLLAMILFSVWIIFGNIVEIAYLAKYLVFTFYEDSPYPILQENRLNLYLRSEGNKNAKDRTAHFL